MYAGSHRKRYLSANSDSAYLSVVYITMGATQEIEKGQGATQNAIRQTHT